MYLTCLCVRKIGVYQFLSRLWRGLERWYLSWSPWKEGGLSLLPNISGAFKNFKIIEDLRKCMLLSTPTKTSQDSGCGPGGTCSSGEERVKTNPGKMHQLVANWPQRKQAFREAFIWIKKNLWKVLQKGGRGQLVVIPLFLFTKINKKK